MYNYFLQITISLANRPKSQVNEIENCQILTVSILTLVLYVAKHVQTVNEQFISFIKKLYVVIFIAK